MKTLFKVLAVLMLMIGAMPSKGQDKVIYPMPLLHEKIHIWGYAYNYDRKKQVIDYLFDEANQFESATGLAQVWMDGKTGAIDVNGNFIIEPAYDDIIYQPYSNTYVVVIDGKHGEMNKHGELIKPIKYDALSAQQKRGWYEYKIGDDYFYIAPDGHVTSNWSDYLNAPFEEW